MDQPAKSLLILNHVEEIIKQEDKVNTDGSSDQS